MTTDEQFEQLEDVAFAAQEVLIRERFGDEAADNANYGWGIDEIDGYIHTKVYGHGVLTTTITAEPEHEFEPFSEEELA